MTNILKKLKKVNKDIKAKKVELSHTIDPLNGYYSKIANEIDRWRDIREIKGEIKDLYALKFSILESLQIAINAEKCDISSKERELTLNLNA